MIVYVTCVCVCASTIYTYIYKRYIYKNTPKSSSTDLRRHLGEVGGGKLDAQRLIERDGAFRRDVEQNAADDDNVLIYFKYARSVLWISGDGKWSVMFLSYR